MNRNSLIFSFLTLGVASAFASTSAFAQVCSTQLTNKTGDVINVRATYSTGDPNENGEGELPLTVSSSGGELYGVVNAYVVPRSFTYTATADNETISGSAPGADGDEACSLSATANQPHIFSQAWKDWFSTQATIFGGAALTTSTIGALCTNGYIASPICGLSYATASALEGGAAFVFNTLAKDPPDPNFTQIAIAQPPVIPKLGPQRGISKQVIVLYDELLETQATIVGLEQALYTTANRASSASNAGSTYWFEEQSKAAKKLEGDLTVQVRKFKDILDALGVEINKSGLDITITPAQVLDFEISIAYSGLPQTEVIELQKLGLDASSISFVQNLMVVQDVSFFSGSLSAILSSTSNAISKSLQGLADDEKNGYNPHREWPLRGSHIAPQEHSVSGSALTR